MLTFDFNFNEDAMRRKMLEAAERQVQDKLRLHGISTVIAKSLRMEGDTVRFQFSGPDDDVKKAKALFGHQESL